MTYVSRLYLDSESGAAYLHETVDLFKAQPVIVIARCCSKSVTIFRPVLVERHRTASDLPLHQDPTVDGHQRHRDSRVGTQSISGRLLVRGFEICTQCITVAPSVTSIALVSREQKQAKLRC